jgi:hypothetical protein
MVEGVNSSMIYLIYCKNFCKCHHVPPVRIRKKKRKCGIYSKTRIKCAPGNKTKAPLKADTYTNTIFKWRLMGFIQSIFIRCLSTKKSIL